MAAAKAQAAMGLVEWDRVDESAAERGRPAAAVVHPVVVALCSDCVSYAGFLFGR